MGTDGNLYFSHALQNDSRQDYCCNAAFPKLRTIVQKIAMGVTVRSGTVFKTPSMVLAKIRPDVTLCHSCLLLNLHLIPHEVISRTA